MRDLRLTVAIKKPASEVFAFTLNPENTPKWLDSVVVEEASEYPVRVGTIYKNKDKNGVWSEYVVAEFVPDRLFMWDKKGSNYHVRYTFTPVEENACELEYYEWVDEGDIKEPFTMKILEKLKKVMETK